MLNILLLLAIFYLSLRITQEILSIYFRFKVNSMRKKLPYIMDLALNQNKIDEARAQLSEIMKEIAEL